MSVVLVGPMGAGKTTVGALLAEAWGVAARDTDADVEELDGRTPVYESVATLVVDTDSRTPSEVADEIIEALS